MRTIKDMLLDYDTKVICETLTNWLLGKMSLTVWTLHILKSNSKLLIKFSFLQVHLLTFKSTTDIYASVGHDFPDESSAPNFVTLS